MRLSVYPKFRDRGGGARGGDLATKTLEATRHITTSEIPETTTTTNTTTTTAAMS